MTRVPYAADERRRSRRWIARDCPASADDREQRPAYDAGRCAERLAARGGRGARDMDARLDRLRNRLGESRAIAEIAARHLAPAPETMAGT